MKGEARVGGEIVRCSLCSYLPPCPGVTATLGPPETHDGCVNRRIVCNRCGATGTRSTNTETR
jgi:hypothetical protein